MALNANITLPQALFRWSRYLLLFVVVNCVAVIAGWLLDIPVLKQPLPNTVAMNPLTAVLFLVACTACYIKTSPKHQQHFKTTASFYIFLIILVSTIKIADEIFKLNIHIDQYLFKNQLIVPGSTQENQMAINTAFGFILCGIALIYINTETKSTRIPSQYFAMVTALLALLAIITYIYRTQNAVYIDSLFIPLGTHAAFCFSFLCLAIIFVHSDKGIMKQFTANFSGSANARMLIPVAIVIPIVLGLLRLFAFNKGWVTPELGTALLIFTIILVFLIFIWYSSSQLNRRDARGKKAEENIRYNSLLLDNVSDAIISTDEQLVIKSWNNAAEKMYGYTAQEVKGKNISFLGLPLSPETLEQHKQSVKQQGFYRDEYTVRDKNGKDITILASFNVIEVDDQITGYVAVHRDISIRKILETQLRTFNKDLSRLVEEKTAEMKSVFDRVSDAFLALDKDWRYTYANKQLSDMIRMDSQKLIGKNIWEAFPDAVGSVTYEMFHRSMKEQRYICSTDYYAPLDLWLENHIYPSPNGISVFTRDVTERKKAEEKIMKANRIYFFISQVNQMIVHTTTEEILFKEACRIAVETGKFKMAWIGIVSEKTNSLIPVMHAGDSAGYKEIIKRISLGDSNLNNPVASVMHDAKNKVINDLSTSNSTLATIGNFKSCMAVPLTRSGKIVGVFSFYTDIKNFFDAEEISLIEEAASDVSFAMDVLEKERVKKITEHALKNSEEKYRSLVEQAADGIVIFDNKMQILDINFSATQLLGYSREELIGLSLKNILSAVELKTNPVNFNVLGTGESTIKLRKMIRKNGSVVETEVHTKKLADGSFIALIRDLTDRKKAELELKQSYEAIRELVSHLQDIREQERLKMAQEIHDELGQQLTIMKMDVSWLDQKLADINPQFKEKTEALKITLDGTVKTVQRIASELRPSVLDDMGLAVAIEWHAREIEKRSELKITLRHSVNIPPLSDHHKISLFRVAQESLTNVIRYANAKTVDIDLDYRDRQVILSISDDGIGFEPDKITVKKTLGILGMKERIAALGGQFNVKSSPGNGSTVTVHVPAQE